MSDSSESGKASEGQKQDESQIKPGESGSIKFTQALMSTTQLLKEPERKVTAYSAKRILSEDLTTGLAKEEKKEKPVVSKATTVRRFSYESSRESSDGTSESKR